MTSSVLKALPHSGQCTFSTSPSSTKCLALWFSKAVLSYEPYSHFSHLNLFWSLCLFRCFYISVGKVIKIVFNCSNRMS